MPRVPGLIVLTAAIAVWGCVGRPSARDGSAGAPIAAVVLGGSAFEKPAARDEAVAAIGGVLGRSVRVVVEEPVERVIASAGTRLGRPLDRNARGEARVAACRKQRNVATALAARADVILRVRLDAKTTARPATAAERTTLAGDGVLQSVGIGIGDTLRDTKLDGTIERTTFPGTATTAKARIRATDRRLVRAGDTTPPSVRAALESALRKLPAATPPRWEPLARGLVTAGCPVLGAAVGDAFLTEASAQRRIRSAATAATAPAPVVKRDETAPPAPTPDLAEAPVEPEPVEAEPPAPVDVAATKPDGATTCTNLCSLQMIELCNNDRSLWSQNGSRWEDTRCGLRRDEAFLANCYRMQWLSGTYERACVSPCEASDDGRTRLVTMLRRAGCIRGS